jgi:hypothetical protein
MSKIKAELLCLNVKTDSGEWLPIGLDELQAEADDDFTARP